MTVEEAVYGPGMIVRFTVLTTAASGNKKKFFVLLASFIMRLNWLLKECNMHCHDRQIGWIGSDSKVPGELDNAPEAVRSGNCSGTVVDGGSALDTSQLLPSDRRRQHFRLVRFLCTELGVYNMMWMSVWGLVGALLSNRTITMLMYGVCIVYLWTGRSIHYVWGCICTVVTIPTRSLDVPWYIWHGDCVVDASCLTQPAKMSGGMRKTL